MFEDSLMESTRRIRTRSRRYAFGSFLIEAALVAVMVLIPYLYPAALPKKFLSVPLIAPPAMVSAAPSRQRASAPAPRVQLAHLEFTAPSRIPNRIAQIADAPPPGISSGPEDIGDLGGRGNGIAGGMPGPGLAPATPQVKLAKPKGPVRVSAGVAAGQLVAPIVPHYPAIALAARVEGTVVVAATISAEGRIENLRVISGPPMLVRAATDAIAQARWRPYELNGEPVEVETTITVVFSLGDEQQGRA